MKRVAIYDRSARKYENSECFLDSIVECLNMISEKGDDWKLCEYYVDEGVSGLTLKGRKGFSKMLNDAVDGNFDIVLVKNIAVFSRDVKTASSILNVLENTGVAVCYPNDNTCIDSNSMMISFNRSV